MKEYKEIDKARVVTRKNSRAVEIAVWGLVLLEAVRMALPYINEVL